MTPFDAVMEKKRPEIEKLYHSGISMGKIYKTVGVCRSSLIKYYKKWGLDTSRFCPNKAIPLKSYTEDVIKDYNSGMSTCDIGAKYGFADNNVWQLLKKNNVDIRHSFEIPHTFFDNIDTEQKAYILGFFMADGCNTNGYFKIAITDHQLVEDVRIAMKYDGPLKYKKSNKDSQKPQWELCIGSKYMCERLTQLNCPPRKTFVTKLPSEHDLPNSLFHHFLRGLIDGDGCIYKVVNRHGYVVSLAGTKELLDGINTHLDGRLYMLGKVRQFKSIYTLTFHRHDYVFRLLNFLYKDATIFLDRKKKLADQYLQWHDDAFL